MRQSNRYLKRVSSLTGKDDPLEAVKAFVARHRETSESIADLARKLGISEITEEKLPFEGGIFRRGSGELVIKINADSPYLRKRFTLAHEVGHLLLDTVPAFRGTDCADKPLESACDAIAAELLMPLDKAAALVKSLGQPCPAKLRAIASTFDVSLQMAAIRVHSSLRLWKCSIGLWERNPHIKTVWFVGPRKWDRTDPDACSLELAVSAIEPVEAREFWQKGPTVDPIWLRLLRLSENRVLGLVGFVN